MLMGLIGCRHKTRGTKPDALSSLHAYIPHVEYSVIWI